MNKSEYIPDDLPSQALDVIYNQGLKVGADAYFELNKQDQAVVAFGMMPKTIMDIIEDQYRLKQAELIGPKYGFDLEDKALVERLKKAVKKSAVNEFLRGVSVGMMQSAKKMGRMIA